MNSVESGAIEECMRNHPANLFHRKEKEKPNCFNRPDYKDSHQAQDGWRSVGGGWDQGLVPKMVTIKNVMSKECRQNEPLGAATIYKWDCKGCRHHAESQ